MNFCNSGQGNRVCVHVEQNKNNFATFLGHCDVKPIKVASKKVVR